MTGLTGRETSFSGGRGRAELVPMPDIPQIAETVCTWLVTAPHAHPAWSQYMLGTVRLRDLEGFPPPKRHFTGATHEINVVALNPEHGRFTVAKMQGYYYTGDLPCLLPVNIAHQIQATDEEARMLAGYAAWGICHGVLWPETSDAPDRIREEWESTLVKTLAHIRGEEHAP